MLDSFYLALFTFFFFAGVISVLFALLMLVIRPRDGEMHYVVTVFDENEKNAVARIGYLLTRVTAAGDGKTALIVAVDNGMPADQYASVIRAFASESRVVLCPRESLGALLFADADER